MRARLNFDVWRGWLRSAWPVLLVVLLVLPALQPLWQAGLQQTDDGAHHVFRLFSLDRALRAGHIGARWQPEEGFGYGFPVLNFYAPLSYYFGLLFHRLGAGFVTSFEWTLAAGLVLSAVAMYLFARELLGRWGGALAAVAYAWAPYHLADAWMRGALAEHLAFIWLPLLLLALLQVSQAAGCFSLGAETEHPERRASGPGAAWRRDARSRRGGLIGHEHPSTTGVVRRPSAQDARAPGVNRDYRAAGRSEPPAMWWPVLWGGAAVAGLVLTHNLTVLLAVPALAVWTLLLTFAGVSGRAARWRFLRGTVLMGLLGLALSAAFWLPALAEARYVRAGNIPEEFAAWSRALEQPRYLLGGSWDHRYVTPERGIEHRLGLAQGLLAVLGLAVGLRRWRRLPRVAAWALPALAGLTLFALFMQSQLSTTVWRIPGLLLLQFPWRWQTLAALSTALLTGYLALMLPRELGSAASAGSMVHPHGHPDRPTPRFLPLVGSVLVILVALLLASAALPNLPWQPMNIPATDIPATDENINLANLAMYDYGRGLWLREHGSPWMFEYMPISVQTPREEFFLPNSRSASATVPLAVTVTPGRQAPLARAYRVASAQPWTFQLHQFYFPGWEAVIDGRVRPASATGPLGLAGVTVPAGEHAIVFRFGSTLPRRIGWAITLATLAGVLLFSVHIWSRGFSRLAWLRARLVPFIVIIVIYAVLTAAARLARPADFTPAAVGANFANQVQLAGYHAPADTLRPDREAAVLLHWLALTDPATNYKVFVHLIDAGGQLWAQHDGEPGFFFSPTTRWQAGEVVDDTHILEWQGDPPPGRYQLRAGLYDPATGARLAVLGPDGQPVADQVLLAEFDMP